MSIGIRTGLLLAGTLLLPGAYADSPSEAPGDAPFLWRNSGPIATLFGLPRARTAVLPAAGEVHADLLFELSSHFTSSQSPREAVLIDGETATLVARFERGFAEHWAASVELVGMRHSGGFLDRVIDQWHDWFGLPEGGRDVAPRDRLRMVWDADGERRLELVESHTGAGDVRIGLARQLHRSPARDVALRLDAELPVGRSSRLTGSNGVDVALGVSLTEREALAGLGLSSHFTLGVLRPAGDGLVGDRLRDVAGFGNWTLVWPVTERLTLKAQIDGHTELVRSDLKQIGGWSIQGGLGGAWQVSPGLALEFAVYEDLRPGSAPDVSFQFALRGRY
ncbi:MAG: DUF3187 family protein [Gammaproteobacteria bacterium]|nr:DUF3187 family protein [Gammaproteobacteria bacterium]